MSARKKSIFGRKVMATPLVAASCGMALLLIGAGCSDRVPCGDLVGTYVTTFTDREGVFSSRGLMTFTSEGILVVSDSAQGGVPGLWDPFSTAQGAWKCLSDDGGKPRVSAVGLNFVLPDDGSAPSFARVDYQAGFDIESGKVSGRATLRFTSGNDLESAAPVHNPGDLADEFDFEGERVAVEK